MARLGIKPDCRRSIALAIHSMAGGAVLLIDRLPNSTRRECLLCLSPRRDAVLGLKFESQRNAR